MIESAILVRLATSKDTDGKLFLGAHHLAAADRLEALVARARLVPRVTMSYEQSTGSRNRSINTAGDISDSAAHARGQLNALAARLPPDCWNVMFDVCCLGKGLQDIEAERKWPRRSAKLVLRIGLEQLAGHFGLAPHQAGSHGMAVRGWLEEKPPLFTVAGT